jgi:site-specific recombinase XerD
MRRQVGKRRFGTIGNRKVIIACLTVLPLHPLPRALAINMLRAGVDIFSLQKLMGHADLQALRRFLSQTTGDIAQAYMIGSTIGNAG